MSRAVLLTLACLGGVQMHKLDLNDNDLRDEGAIAVAVHSCVLDHRFHSRRTILWPLVESA